MVGRIAVVTGGTRRIGAAIAQSLKEEGCRLAVSYRSDDAPERIRNGNHSNRRER